MRWVHPLDRNLIAYQEYGKGHTLPTFWTTCAGCEASLAAGDDAVLIDRMKQSRGFQPSGDDWSPEDVQEQLMKPLTVFRRSDRGPLPLGSTTG